VTQRQIASAQRVPTESESDACVLLVVRGRDGHRADYLDLFSALLPQSVAASELLRARDLRRHRGPLFFLTIDDHLATFFAAAVSRSIYGRRTVGLLLRAGECMKSDFKYRVKRALFQLATKIPHVRIVTILPFYVEPDFARIATDWIDDPQIWDLDGAVDVVFEANSSIAATVKNRAKGRRVVMALGGQNRIKGFDFFAQLWLASEKLRGQFFFCSAGAVDTASSAAKNALVETDALIFDQRISNDELISLYDCADIVWSCYAPDYNQASGIFGRAAQFGIPSLVREGSYLEKIAAHCEQPFLSLPFGDAGGAAEMLMQWKPEPRGRHSVHVREAKRRTLAVLGDALQLGPETRQSGLPQ
jgi:hypothetical protein